MPRRGEELRQRLARSESMFTGVQRDTYTRYLRQYVTSCIRHTDVGPRDRHPRTNSRRSFTTPETASLTGICSLILRRPVKISSIPCIEPIALRYCIMGFCPRQGGGGLEFREDLDAVIGWSIRRTGNKLISSRRATIRRERRIRELRVSSSSFCVRLLSLRVNARSRLNSSLWPQSKRTHQVGETKNTC